jgi:poly-gamma-glutamate capsule biosynthesis protein CapA/YwtB (metallophosphatase superfamily)
MTNAHIRHQMDARDELTLFLCGDLMSGRGIDQVLPHSCAPHLYERVVNSALGYVELAERANGPIPRRVGYGRSCTAAVTSSQTTRASVASSSSATTWC